VEVKILKFDAEKERVSLGLKQVQPNPWEKAKENTNDGNEKLTIQEAINAIKSMKNQ